MISFNSAQAIDIEHAYILAQTDVASGPNIITQYTYDDKGITGSVNYAVIPKTTYGSGPNSKEFTLNLFGKDETITFNYNTLEEKKNVSTSDAVSGDFYGLTTTSNAQGAAVRVYDGSSKTTLTVDSISGNFINNAGNFTKSAESAAFYNYAEKILSISGNFVGNYIQNTGTSSSGRTDSGALLNNGGTIDEISANFVGNRSYVTATGVYTMGGAFFNRGGTIGKITGDFISNSGTATLDVEGGAMANAGQIGSITSNFIGNYAYCPENPAYGGAYYSNGNGVVGSIDEEGNITGGFINSSFINNYAKTDQSDRPALGGAIVSNAPMYMVYNEGVSYIAGNYTDSAGVIDDNAIFMSNKPLVLNVTNNAKLFLMDNIDGTSSATTNITGDGTGTIYWHNDIRIATTMKDITLNTINSSIRENKTESLTLLGDVDMAVDIDFISGTMDRITAETYGEHVGNLNVTDLNILYDGSTVNRSLVEIKFADDGLKENVSYSGATSLTTPLYVYDISYQNKKDGGYFVFAGGSAVGEGKGFNPTVLSSSVNSTVGALGTMNQTFTYSFQNSDNYMNIPYAERLAYKNRNRYAISPMANGKFSPLFTHDEVGSVWVKPYATFESVNLDNGPKVSSISYGTLIGFDTGIESIGNGWDRAITGFIGYNGASQSYRGVDSIQNGGMLGGTMTLYKKNFFNATTVSVGASVANNQTMYGNEDYAMLLSGIANKAGYNYEFKEGKFIIQPSMLLSYTFVNTFDYTNAAGVRMQNDPFHSLQISPGLKFIGNFKNGWQPYLGVNMVWNIMGETNAYANGVKLPQMSVKPYVQYGVGVQKRMKDHLMAYGQAMVQNGGRNGLALTCGIRWSIGCKSCQKHQKVEGTKRYSDENQNLTMVKTKSLNGEILKQVQDDRGKYIDNKTSSLDVGGVMPRAAEHKKIIKQMTPQQRYAMGARPYNPARIATTSSTVIKQYK